MTYLNLVFNYLKNHAIDIGKVLEKNNTLTRINLYGCFNDKDEYQYIFKALEKNTSLKRLDLGYDINLITEIDYKYIVKALEQNTSLKVLKFRHNNIDDKGVMEIAKGLIKNKPKPKLDLRENKITDQGAKFLREALNFQILLIRS